MDQSGGEGIQADPDSYKAAREQIYFLVPVLDLCARKIHSSHLPRDIVHVSTGQTCYKQNLFNPSLFLSPKRAQLCTVLQILHLRAAIHRLSEVDVLSLDLFIDHNVLCVVTIGHKLVGLGSPELSGGHLVLEQDIEFTKGPVLGLGKSEPTPDVAKQVGTGVEETNLGSPAPASGGDRVDHSWGDRVGEDTGKVVNESTNDNSLVPKTTGRSLSDNGVTCGTDGNHVDQSVDDQGDSDTKGGSLVAGRSASQTADDDTKDKHDSETAHVDSGPSQPSHQSPADKSTDDVA